MSQAEPTMVLDSATNGNQPKQFKDKSDHGYRKDLKSRHMRMIAIGGAIGSGLFYGASGRIAAGGAGIAILYVICGFVAYLMLRALAEMTLHRPSSGGFISYAREFMGEKGAFFTGWFSFITWSTALMADITAIANYLYYWPVFHFAPRWVWAFLALAIVVLINLASVKFFGEFEFWFSMVKVAAIILFMILALGLIFMQIPINHHTPGLHLITENGGFFPHGGFALVTLSIGVLFAFGGSEFIGLAAGEASNPHREMPRAVNSLIWRIVFFYVGCIVLFTLLLPYNQYDPNESPFVTIFKAIGVPGAGSIMNLVVMIAAASAINAELYTAGRGLRSMAVAGSAPSFLRGMNRNAVPYAAICAAATVGLIGVVVNLFIPEEAFEVIASLAGIGICTMWGSIMISNLIFVRRCRREGWERPSFHLWFAPYSNILVLLVLVGMIVLMWWEGGSGPITILTFLGITVVMVVVWQFVKKNIDHNMFEEATDEATA